MLARRLRASFELEKRHEDQVHPGRVGKNIAEDWLLQESGSDKSRILMAQIFLANLSDLDGMNEAWDAWVAPGNAPPRTTVQALLANPAWRIKVVITAALR